jgi:ABC-2 type transport system permease protein
MEQVGDEDLAAAIIVPPGYGEQVLAAEEKAPPRPTVIVIQDSSSGNTALNGVQVAVARLVGAGQAARLSAQAFEARGGTADREFMEEAWARAIEAWADPPLTVAETQPGVAAGAEEESDFEPSNSAHSSAGIMVQFAMAGLIGAAEILVMERKTGALRRLLTTPISRIEIILGHSLAMYLMILLQLAILVAFGQLALGVDYMRVPLATLLLVAFTALWSASLGLLIGVFARTEEQVAMLAIVLMLVLAGLGGAWMPLEFTGKAFQTIGHLTPTAWAIDGFENIVMRGLGLESVWLPVAILGAYTVAFFAVAVWRFGSE